MSSKQLDLLRMSGESFESIFDVSHEEEVGRFLTHVQELMPKECWYVRD